MRIQQALRSLEAQRMALAALLTDGRTFAEKQQELIEAAEAMRRRANVLRDELPEESSELASYTAHILVNGVMSIGTDLLLACEGRLEYVDRIRLYVSNMDFELRAFHAVWGDAAAETLAQQWGLIEGPGRYNHVKILEIGQRLPPLVLEDGSAVEKRLDAEGRARRMP